MDHRITYRQRARATLVSWTRDWGGLLTIAVALFLVWYVLWLIVVQPQDAQKVWVTDIAQPMFSLCMTILATRAARRSTLDLRKRRAWLILAVAFLMYCIGNITWAYYELVVKSELAVTWADVPYLMYYPLALIGLLTFPMERSGRSRLTFALDASTVMLAASIVVWYVVLRPVALAEHASSLEAVVTLAYPVANTVLLFGVVAVLLRRPPENARRALSILTLAIFFDAVADFGYAYQTLENSYFGGQWPDCFYMLGFLLMAVSAQYQVYSIGRHNTKAEHDTESSPFSWLPYVAVGVAYALLLLVVFKFQREHGSEPIVWLALGAFLITALVVARQIVALRENSRLLAEKAARESEIRLSALVQHSSDAISIIDREGYVFYTSPANKAIFGYGAEDLQGRRLREMIHPDDCERALNIVSEVITEPGKPRSITARVRNRDRDWIHVESVLTNLLDQSAIAGIVINSRDVSERKRAEEALRESEERLRQAQKMEAIGQLAGGVAHDFNNLLAVIIGYADMLLRRASTDDRTLQQISEIKKAGDRAKALTSQLLAFSRKQVLQPKVLDLNGVIKDLDKMLRRLIGENIEMQALLKDDLGNVRADPGRIEQVLLNLVVNARDAMPDGGKLIVKTKNVRIGECYTQSNPALNAGLYVMMSVADTGCGMSEEVQSRIFEPFFTTKETGRGTGLGLSTVYGIIQQSGGHVQVMSKPGEGTTFRIYLPRIDEAVKSDARESAQLSAGTETVLLVEDEEAVRHMAQEILTSNGYRVLDAGDGVDAVELSSGYNGPIDLMVTDVVMPRLGGRELAERLSVTRPDMRVLYMSGYTDDAIVHHGVLDGRAAFLEKPFTPDALAIKIREVLSA